MSMFFFRGTMVNKIDSKGRLSVPARFRAVIEADGLQSIYCCKSLVYPILEAGGRRLLEEVDEMLSGFSLYSSQRHDLAHALIGESDDLPLDKEGRIVLPERFRQFAGLEEEVAFVGIGLRFALWAPARLAEHLDASRSRARSFLENWEPAT